MNGLLYKEDFDEARDRLAVWWNGGDIGRPAMLITVPRATPAADIPEMPQPQGWVTDYSTSSFEYRVNLSLRACNRTHYLAEAIPTVAPDLAPNCLALYLGCKGVESPGTVWCEPCIARPETAVFRNDPRNSYWQFTLRLGAEQIRLGKDKFMVQYPDLIEGLDTLAAMRGTESLLMDLVERPAWVQDSLKQITTRYFEYYDALYELFKDDRGGSHFWAWAPGRMAKFQCDFSAMISPAMFGEFMVPVLREMTQRVDYCMYHWDGPGALGHHDHLLSVPDLTMLQWEPGAGVEPHMHRRWWPVYHKTIDAGKKHIVRGSIEELKVFKKEFGPKLKQFMIWMNLDSLKQVDEVMGLVNG